MNIAMMSAHGCPAGMLGARAPGGMSVYVRETALQLSRSGHHVDIFTRRHGSGEPEELFFASHCRLIHIPAGDENLADKLLVYNVLPEFACGVEQYRRTCELHYDVIFGHYWLSGLAGNYLRKWWHVPDIVMFHTLGAVKNAVSYSDDTDLRIATEREIIDSCRHIIASTERERDELHNYYNAELSKISVVPCGVNLNIFYPSDRKECRKKLGYEDEVIIFYAGRIDPIKGIDRLITAVPGIRSNQKVRLVIAGGDTSTDALMNSLQKLANRITPPASVEFAGRIPHESLREYYSAADVFVLPSYHESFGLAAFEALACGTPVVAADIGGLAQVIVNGFNGWIVADNTPEQLALGINSVLSHIGHDRETRRKIRASVASYSWDTVGQKLADVFQQTLVKND